MSGVQGIYMGLRMEDEDFLSFFLSGLNFCKLEFYFKWKWVLKKKKKKKKKRSRKEIWKRGGFVFFFILLLFDLINGQDLLVAGPPIHSFYT
jgi:uncharacterized membrane protein